MKNFIEMTQFVVPVTNKPGQLHRITDILGSKGVDLLSLTTNVIGDVAFVKFATDYNPTQIVDILQGVGLTTLQVPAVGIKIGNKPGAISNVLKYLNENKINILDTFSTVIPGSTEALIVFTLEGAVTGEVPTKVLFENYFEQYAKTPVGA